MDIGPGDLVECVDDNFPRSAMAGDACPSLGIIYTIRDFRDSDAVLLEEIKNPSRYFRAYGFYERSFYLWHFRPIRSTETSMKILREAVEDVLDRVST